VATMCSQKVDKMVTYAFDKGVFNLVLNCAPWLSRLKKVFICDDGHR